VPVLERRLDALARFYAPLGFTHVAVRREGHMLGGSLSGSPGRADLDAGLLVWGDPLPQELADPLRLIDAQPAALRRMHGTICALALGNDTARLVNSPAGATVLYEASSDDVAVWSTHAVAAGWLARGSAAIDEEAIPELMAFEFVGAGRTLVRGVTPVPPASCVRFDAGGPRAQHWWPAPARWERVPEDEAQAAGEAALLATLEARLRGHTDVWLGLTAGLDSRMTALALLELGLRPKAFTWGEPDWPDAVGATEVAAAIGMEHSVFPPEWYGDAEAIEAHECAVRFADGVAGLAEADRRWPGESGPIAAGVAAEIGRAYYYGPWPVHLGLRSVDDLVAALTVSRRLWRASAEAVALAEASLRRWVGEAMEVVGLDFRALDLVYTDQRLAHWSRSQVPALARTVFAGLTSVDFSRALVSLPLADRLGDRFRQRFVAARAPELAPTPKELPARPARLAIPFHRLNLARHRRRRRAPSINVADPWVRDRWRARPEASAWVVDEVLEHPLIAGTMGREWADGVRAGFLEGRVRDTALALRAAGPVRLERSLITLSAA
jgi:hypothetical protein